MTRDPELSNERDRLLMQCLQTRIAHLNTMISLGLFDMAHAADNVEFSRASRAVERVKNNKTKAVAALAKLRLTGSA